MLLTRSGTVHSSAGFAPDIGVCINKEHILFIVAVFIVA